MSRRRHRAGGQSCRKVVPQALELKVWGRTPAVWWSEGVRSR